MIDLPCRARQLPHRMAPGTTRRGQRPEWSADPTGNADPAETLLPIPYLRGQAVTARILYPSSGRAGISWDPGEAALVVSLPRAPSAVS